MLAADLQSWGKCGVCKGVLWCEASEHHQAVVCLCGASECHDTTKNDGPWDQAFTEANMQAVLDGTDPEDQS